jgi:hypothetical protein
MQLFFRELENLEYKFKIILSKDRTSEGGSSTILNTPSLSPGKRSDQNT